MKVTNATIKSVNGGVNNQVYVEYQTAFSFNAADTDYVNATEPWKDAKGFAAMSPFARDTTLTSTTYLDHYLYGTIYYRISHATAGVVTYTAAGPTMSWSQVNVP